MTIYHVTIYHVTTAAEWEQAVAAGEYRMSTRGRTLQGEGFIHCSYVDQVGHVVGTFYRGVHEPLVVLTIDTTRLPAPVIAENTGGGTELFPHVYGPLPVSAVTAVTPLEREPDGDPGAALDPSVASAHPTPSEIA